MKRLLSLVIFLFLMGIIPFTLIHCNNERGEISITDIEIKTANANFEDLDTSITYPYQQIFKVIEFSEWEVISNLFNRDFLVCPSFATSPAPPIIMQEFESITIKALNSFTLDDPNETILPGQDITDRFIIGQYVEIDFTSIEEFIETNKIFDQFDRYLLQIANPPISETNMIFKVTITMTDGEIYEFENEILNIE
ncbi:MAG: hypothetical protein ACFHWX_14265 [Bacteroidota bacterium]